MIDTPGGDWKFFNYEPSTGRTIWVLHSPDGTTTYRVDTPVDPILEANAEAEKLTHGARFGDWVRVASIPLQHYHASGMADAVVQDDHGFISRMINDGEYAKFRTSRGQF